MTAPSAEKEQAASLLGEVPSTRGAGLPPFFLHELQIKGFRSIEDATFHFQPSLNVIIGANNAAKSAVIDALRVIFSLGSFEAREDYIKLRRTDIFTDGTAIPDTCSISFTGTFYGKAESDVPAQFMDLLCPSEEVKPPGTDEAYAVFKLMYRVDYEYSKKNKRYEYVRSETKGGPNLTNPVSSNTLDSMRSIYLAPLRDLIDDRVRVGAEIERLILSHTPKGKEDERAAIPRVLQEKAKELIKGVTGDNHQVAAGKALARYARPYRISDDSLSFLPAGITDSLFGTMWPVFAHGLHGVDGLPLSSNGLGINQLIYASIVLSRRGETDVDDHVHKFFLIEEPEAHLHPQLQDSFFHALNLITDHQVFVTSHSPTVTAKTYIEKIIVMRRDEANRAAAPLHLAQVFEGRDEDKKYLHKFLDVTRSQLLFANGAVFIEGVTEGMLMQPFSELIGRSLRDAAVEVVVLDSKWGFDHFRPLFDNSSGTYSRAVFITDGDEDPTQKKDADYFADSGGDLDRTLAVQNNSAVAVGYGTFEFALLRTAVAKGGNSETQMAMQALLTETFKDAAPYPVKKLGKQNEFAADFMDFSRPALAYMKMREKKRGKRVDKSDWQGGWQTNTYFVAAKSAFSFNLEVKLTDLGTAGASSCFIVPAYIQEAIKFVVAEPPLQEPDDAPDA